MVEASRDQPEHTSYPRIHIHFAQNMFLELPDQTDSLQSEDRRTIDLLMWIFIWVWLYLLPGSWRGRQWMEQNMDWVLHDIDDIRWLQTLQGLRSLLRLDLEHVTSRSGHQHAGRPKLTNLEMVHLPPWCELTGEEISLLGGKILDLSNPTRLFWFINSKRKKQSSAILYGSLTGNTAATAAPVSAKLWTKLEMFLFK